MLGTTEEDMIWIFWGISRLCGETTGPISHTFKEHVAVAHKRKVALVETRDGRDRCLLNFIVSNLKNYTPQSGLICLFLSTLSALFLKVGSFFRSFIVVVCK